MVDLPGITKVPVGDQPQDIESQIKKLVFEKIRNPNSIILAVSAANVDLATSEALKFAKEVDPDGSRTLAVLTKLDLMDKGTDATEILSGKVIPVKLGIIGVVNRSQQSINENKNIDDQLDMEEEFLETNYPDLASVNGTPFLEQELSIILINHIKSCLPDLTVRLNQETLKYQEKIKSLGKAVVDEKSAMINAITQFAKSFISSIEGTASVDKNYTTNLYKIIHEDFKNSLKSIKTVDESDIAGILLDSSSESRPTLFVMPSFDESFDNVVTKKIKLMHEPSKSCAQKIQLELQRLIKDCTPEVQQEMLRFPRLFEKIAGVVNRMISERLETTKDKIDDIIECQTAYTNKNHPQFDKAGALMLIRKRRIVNNVQENYLPEFGENLTIDEQKKVLNGLINNYLEVERTIVQDNVAKAIMCFMVNYIKKNIGNKLLVDVFNPVTAAELMKEPKGIEKNRRNAIKMLQVS